MQWNDILFITFLVFFAVISAGTIWALWKDKKDEEKGE
jgi:hypothetical protein